MNAEHTEYKWRFWLKVQVGGLDWYVVTRIL